MSCDTDPHPLLAAFPMHGYHKLLAEGFRTRDGHLLQWMGRILGGHGVGVYSRPEPFPRQQLARRRTVVPSTSDGLVDHSRTVLAVPNLRDRQEWWVRSARHYRVPDLNQVPVVLWNPFAAPLVSNATTTRSAPVLLDLLDDWTVHAAFAGVHEEVDRAYAQAFEHADVITANSEGTLALAHRYGRTDTELMPNGCDPDRFSTTSRAAGRTRVGYAGKLGDRVDFHLIAEVARACPDIDFMFCGPALDAEARQFVQELPPNISWLGDLHYKDIPDFLERLDVGWIPHRVGEGEVGGDAIKLYEYRATGLPVLTTPIGGVSSRGLHEIHVLRTAAEHATWIRDVASSGPRVSRRPEAIPEGLTWRSKAVHLLERLGLGPVGG